MEFETTILDLNEYLECIFEMTKFIKKNTLYHEELYFRGHSNNEYKLLPSIARGRRFSCDVTIMDEERNMIEEAKYKLSSIFTDNMLPIDLLSLLQHHGIPTRLLDITSNPLIALYFAVSLDDDKDAEVIVFRHMEYDITTYPIINAIADSYRFAHATTEPLDLFYAKVIEQPYFNEQRFTLKFCYTDKITGGKWINECCNELLVVHAREQTERQKAQQGKYILFHNDIKPYGSNNLCFEKMISEIPKDEKHIFKRIIIPKEIKKDLRKKLRILGISKEILFPDNIDIICESIKRNAEERL